MGRVVPCSQKPLSQHINIPILNSHLFQSTVWFHPYELKYLWHTANKCPLFPRARLSRTKTSQVPGKHHAHTYAHAPLCRHLTLTVHCETITTALPETRWPSMKTEWTYTSARPANERAETTMLCHSCHLTEGWGDRQEAIKFMSHPEASTDSRGCLGVRDTYTYDQVWTGLWSSVRHRRRSVSADPVCLHLLWTSPTGCPPWKPNVLMP